MIVYLVYVIVFVFHLTYMILPLCILDRKKVRYIVTIAMGLHFKKPTFVTKPLQH
jgi:hypothetical protein